MEKVVKEVKLKVGGIWSCITAIVIAAMLCGTVVFVSMQHNKTQWDIANKQAQSAKESADKISEGLSDIGSGVCQTSNQKFVFCGN